MNKIKSFFKRAYEVLDLVLNAIYKGLKFVIDKGGIFIFAAVLRPSSAPEIKAGYTSTLFASEKTITKPTKTQIATSDILIFFSPLFCTL